MTAPAVRLRRPPPATEEAEQRALLAACHHFSGRFPALALLFAIPNGGHRTKAVAGKLKVAGVRSGVPDLFLPVAHVGASEELLAAGFRSDGLTYHGLFIEMKRVSGGTVSPEQRAWHDALGAQGYQVIVAKGALDGWRAIAAYLALPADVRDPVWLR